MLEVDRANRPEKLLVEFEVERTVDRPYGYQEKILLFRGNNTRYKAIVKDGCLVAIVSRRYKLIPNEDVKTAVMEIARKRGFRVSIAEPDWRLYMFIEKNSTGVMVSNSVDGTISLKAHAILCRKARHFGRYYSILVSVVRSLYRRHTKHLTIEDLDEAIMEIYDASRRFNKAINDLFMVSVEPYISALKEALPELFPKVYYQGIFSRYYYYGGMSLKDFYEEMSMRIWSRRTDIRTKMVLYKKLNNLMSSLGVIEFL